MTQRAPDPSQPLPPVPNAHRPAADGLRGVARATVDVAAPPERVFRALTEPEELARWWGGAHAGVRDVHADVRPGGRWGLRTTDPAGREADIRGEYRVVDPPHTVETTWEASGDAAPSTVRYDLTPIEVGGAPGTRVTVTHTGTHTSACASLAADTCAATRLRWRLRAPAWAARRRCLTA